MLVSVWWYFSFVTMPKRCGSQGCQLRLMQLVENTKPLCRCIIALRILREWHRLQNCSTTTSPIGGTMFSTQ